MRKYRDSSQNKGLAKREFSEKGAERAGHEGVEKGESVGDQALRNDTQLVLE